MNFASGYWTIFPMTRAMVLSQCTSIDEIFQSISTDELGVYSMMSNYYGN
jgi:hypothetical protein